MPLQTWGQLVKDAPESAGNFEPLADGEYEVVITAAEVRKNQADKVGYNVTIEVESGPNKGRKFFNTFWVSPESPTAMGIFFRQFEALGLPKQAYFVALEPTDEKIAADLVGKRFHAVVGTREWNGKKQNDLKNIQPARGVAPVATAGPAGPVPATPTAVAPAAPAATPTAPPAAPTAPANDAWGSLSTPSAPSAPATPTAPPLPPLGPGQSPF